MHLFATNHKVQKRKTPLSQAVHRGLKHFHQIEARKSRQPDSRGDFERNHSQTSR
jgi:hypothetical protein